MGQINQAVKLDKVIKKFNIKNFIETGTGLGESLEYLLKLDESKDLDIHSIELMEQLYNHHHYQVQQIVQQLVLQHPLVVNDLRVVD